tara:strand:- start:40 stop:648 length:609 start_codon:yes stop_codon:yes gene_type:complete
MYERTVLENMKKEARFYFWGPLLFRTKLDDEQIKDLRKLSEEAKTDNRKKLVGIIKKELNINVPKFTEILQPAFKLFTSAYKTWYGTDIKTVTTHEAWVNFMKKGEYNPPHTHGECDFSSVLYLNVPAGLEKERKQFIGTGLGPGSIVFTIGGTDRFCNTFYSFVPEVGDFFMFPWSLIHFVGPFQCSGTRTSIAANFKVVA